MAAEEKKCRCHYSQETHPRSSRPTGLKSFSPLKSEQYEIIIIYQTCVPPYSGRLTTMKEITIKSTKDLFYCCVYFTCTHITLHVFFLIHRMPVQPYQCLKSKRFAFIFFIYQTFRNHSSIFESELFFQQDCSHKQYASNQFSVTHLSIDIQMRFEMDLVPRNFSSVGKILLPVLYFVLIKIKISDNKTSRILQRHQLQCCLMDLKSCRREIGSIYLLLSQLHSFLGCYLTYC